MRRLVVPVLVVPVLAGLMPAGCAQRAEEGSAPLPLTSGVSAPSEVNVTPKLSPHGKEVLAQARRSGTVSIVLTISTEPGATERAVADLRRLGATVEASDATIGYVRVSVPVELAEEVASAEGISQVDVDEPLSYTDPAP